VFELFTERARRMLFFARYEASQLGSTSIESEHLLLGLLRECRGVAKRLIEEHVALGALHLDLEARIVPRDYIPTSVELPFSAETRRILHSAAREADGLRHNYIGTEHLLLGILNEERSTAASVLMNRGVRLDSVRSRLLEVLGETPGGRGPQRCCFCGDGAAGQDLALLLLHAPGESGRQRLYSHPACLRSRVVEDLRLITGDRFSVAENQ
jgi:ATP-dependent Clp protease ATP-binding subunit ClpC